MNRDERVKVTINNLPDYQLSRYIVARVADGKLWFWGTWEDREEAERVAAELGNGVVVENDT